MFLNNVLGKDKLCWWFEGFFKFDFSGKEVVFGKFLLKFCFVGEVVGELNFCGLWKVKCWGFLFKVLVFWNFWVLDFWFWFCCDCFEFCKMFLFVVDWILEREFLLLLFDIFLFFCFIVVLFDLVNFFFLKVLENFLNGDGICLFFGWVCVIRVLFCKFFIFEVFRRLFCSVVYESGWFVMLNIGGCWYLFMKLGFISIID